MLIHKITKDRRAGEYQLHIKKVLGSGYPCCCSGLPGEGFDPEAGVARFQMLTPVATTRVRIPKTAHLSQTKLACSGTVYSPGKTRRKGPGVVTYR